MLQIVQILGPASSPFVAPQRTDTDIEQTNRPRACFQFDRDSGAPRRAKGYTINLVVKIDPIRRPSELNYCAGTEQFARPLHFRNVIIPKHFKRFEKAACIISRAIVKEINITGEAGISVKNNSLVSDNEATNLKSAQ